CDLVVNVGSTMAMDFAIRGKPGVYIGYDPPGAGSGWSIHDLYRLPHFAGVHELDPVHWARSCAALGEQVMHALANPDEKTAARSAWIERQVELPLDQASRRASDALLRLAGAGKIPRS
ncbi:MAG: hypothetical protein GY856_29200, partial [bacterium]|nr:hypothetical protein [bacterium]